MTATRIRCGVAGTGSLGQHHARIYSTLPGAELAGIFEPNDARAAEICAKHNCHRFATLDEMAAGCDAVSVVVPTNHHAAVALPLLAKGVHLLIEKPICVTLEEAAQILEAAAKADRIVQVGHIEHYNPVMSYLEQAVTDARYITAERLAPFTPRGTEVGVVLDLMIHDIGIVLALAKSPIRKIDSVGISVLSKTEDIANARIEFESGCVANLSASRMSLKKNREIRIFQDNAYLSLDYQSQSGYLLRLAREDEKESSFLGKILGVATDSTLVTEFAGQRIVREPVPVEKDEPLKRELADFVACARAGAQPKVGGQEATAALELGLEITRQIDAGK